MRSLVFRLVRSQNVWRWFRTRILRMQTYLCHFARRDSANPSGFEPSGSRRAQRDRLSEAQPKRAEAKAESILPQEPTVFIVGDARNDMRVLLVGDVRQHVSVEGRRFLACA